MAEEKSEFLLIQGSLVADATVMDMKHVKSCKCANADSPKPFFSGAGRLLLVVFLLAMSLMLFVAHTRLRAVTVMLLNMDKQRPQDYSTQALPQSIVIGVRKCGTRALLEFLGMHPRVQIAPNEIHFFDKDDHYELGLDWYRQKMPNSSRDQLTMEKSPAYFISTAAPPRIHHMNSSIKLLLILRNPITRVLSDYTQVYTKRQSRNESFSHIENLVIDPQTGEVNLHYKPVRISIYHQHWITWAAVFPRSQIHIVDGDKLIQNPLPELVKVEHFLGLPAFLTADNFYYNQTRGFYCMRNTINHQRCLGSSKGRPHPQVDATVMKKLKNFYRLHNQRFYELTGQDFDWDS